MSFKKLFIFVTITLVTLSSFAQKKSTLLTVNGKDIPTSDFITVYEKNLSIVDDPEQKDVTNYLELYKNYLLKLEEAYALKMDTVPSYIEEFKRYKKQLIDPYLKDDNKEKDLIKEAYDRMLKEVNASHILIRMKKDASPEDTLKIYNKILDARNRIVNGESFEEVAKELSHDPSAKDNGGNLGYFTVFQMVYPFENMAYNTPVGEISMPFKTRFGYHIVKVNDIRDSQGEVEVAHIMLEGDTPENQEKIKKIKAELGTGASFETLAKNYSEDGATKEKGGKLPKFSTNKMIPSFSEVAFALKNPGDLSEPFKTRFGWHIIKMIKRYPVGSYEELKLELAKKVKQGQRAKILGRSVIDRLLKEYNIEENAAVVNAFKGMDWDAENLDLPLTKTILKVNERSIPASDFYENYKSNKKLNAQLAFNNFKEDVVLNYYKDKLPEEYPELKQTLKEYREGLLLFDLMQNKVWKKAEQDSLGLESYYEQHKDKYWWKDSVDAVIITTDKEENAKMVKELLLRNVPLDSIKKQIKSKGLHAVKSGTFEKDNTLFPEGFTFIEGTSITEDNGQYKVIKINELLKAHPKKFEETRGRVISDYQDYIEENWLAELRKKYPIKLNEKAFKKLKRKYN